MIDYSKYEALKIEKAERVATVTLNRPDSLNAVDPVMHRELCTIWLDLAVGRPTKHWVNGAASEASASSYK
jgi:enoyl-CoA hydratase/carnithine racemase